MNVFFQNRFVIVAYTLALISNATSWAGENIVSMATGFQGVTSLVQSVELQDAIELSPKQLDDLKLAMAELQVNEEFARVMNAEVAAGHYEAASKIALQAADKLTQQALRKALEVEQIKQLRCIQVTRRCRFPSFLL